nr:NADH dehydrogenase [ubiquinone] iron-sulfur protein 1, mitochondrial [Tanacetum cinerariifolium]
PVSWRDALAVVAEVIHQVKPEEIVGVAVLLLLQSTLMMDDTRTKEDELLFQSALVLVSMDIEGRWEKIAERVPGKTVEDVSAYFEALVCEVI